MSARQVWKYELELTDEQAVSMPEGAVLRHVGVQRGALCLWAEVDPAARRVPRYLSVVGTGNPMLDGRLAHVGTAQMDPFVWHVYEVLSR